MSFAIDMDKFAKKCITNADMVIRKVVLDIGRSVVDQTPVGDPTRWKSKPPAGYSGGHARANWSHSMGDIVTQEFDAIDKSGNVSIQRIAASLPGNAAGNVHFIQNSVPYIQALEDGHSGQAPAGFIAATAAKFSSIIDEAVGDLK